MLTPSLMKPGDRMTSIPFESFDSTGMKNARNKDSVTKQESRREDIAKAALLRVSISNRMR